MITFLLSWCLYTICITFSYDRSPRHDNIDLKHKSRQRSVSKCESRCDFTSHEKELPSLGFAERPQFDASESLLRLSARRFIRCPCRLFFFVARDMLPVYKQSSQMEKLVIDFSKSFFFYLFFPISRATSYPTTSESDFRRIDDDTIGLLEVDDGQPTQLSQPRFWMRPMDESRCVDNIRGMSNDR